MGGRKKIEDTLKEAVKVEPKKAIRSGQEDANATANRKKTKKKKEEDRNEKQNNLKA